MMYRAKRSFVDPATMRPYLRGQEYAVVDPAHAQYLERHHLIERVDDPAPVEDLSAGADSSRKAVSKRRKTRR